MSKYFTQKRDQSWVSCPHITRIYFLLIQCYIHSGLPQILTCRRPYWEEEVNISSIFYAFLSYLHCPSFLSFLPMQIICGSPALVIYCDEIDTQCIICLSIMKLNVSKRRRKLSKIYKSHYIDILSQFAQPKIFVSYAF